MMIRLRSTTKFAVAAVVVGVAPWIAIYAARRPEPVELPPAVRAEATGRLSKIYGEDKSTDFLKFFDSQGSATRALFDELRGDLLWNARCPVPLPNEGTDLARLQSELIDPFLATMAGGFASQADERVAEAMAYPGGRESETGQRYRALVTATVAVRSAMLHRGDIPAAVEALRSEVAVSEALRAAPDSTYRPQFDANAISFAVRQRPSSDDCALLERTIEELLAKPKSDALTLSMLEAIRSFDYYVHYNRADSRSLGAAAADASEFSVVSGAMNVLWNSDPGWFSAERGIGGSYFYVSSTLSAPFTPWTRVAALSAEARARIAERPALGDLAGIPLEVLPEDRKLLGFLATRVEDTHRTLWEANAARSTRTHLHAARIALAARRHWAETGAWPEKIEELGDSIGPFDSPEMRIRNYWREEGSRTATAPEAPFGPFAIRDVQPTINDVATLLGMHSGYYQATYGFGFAKASSASEDGRLHVEFYDTRWLQVHRDYRDVLSWLRLTVPEWIDRAELIDSDGNVMETIADSPVLGELAGQRPMKLRVHLSIPKTLRCVVLDPTPGEDVYGSRPSGLMPTPRILIPLLDEIPKPAN